MFFRELRLIFREFYITTPLKLCGNSECRRHQPAADVHQPTASAVG
jgi:hypothetical protein